MALPFIIIKGLVVGLLWNQLRKTKTGQELEAMARKELDVIKDKVASNEVAQYLGNKTNGGVKALEKLFGTVSTKVGAPTGGDTKDNGGRFGGRNSTNQRSAPMSHHAELAELVKNAGGLQQEALDQCFASIANGDYTHDDLRATLILLARSHNNNTVYVGALLQILNEDTDSIDARNKLGMLSLLEYTLDGMSVGEMRSAELDSAAFQTMLRDGLGSLQSKYSQDDDLQSALENIAKSYLGEKKPVTPRRKKAADPKPE